MTATYHTLQQFIDTAAIPKIKGKPKTFLGIAKQPHYENVWSSIYAFYFKTSEVHGLQELFANSLLSLLQERVSNEKMLAFDTFLNIEVETEYPAKGQQRIDLVLYNETQAIIIENKVYHQLYNDLKAYYDDFKVPHKIGIVLSLKHISNIPHKHFVNITHLELLSRIMQNIGTYLLNASHKYVVFLQDFYQNIINLSQLYMEQEGISFYYKNRKEVNQLVNLKDQLLTHIKEEIVKLGNRLPNVNKYEPRVNSHNDNRVIYYVCPHERNLMIAVIYENLLTDKGSMYIVVEMVGDLLKNRTIYKEQIQFSEAEKAIFAKDFETTKHTWAHFAVKYYKPTADELGNLADYIETKLQEDHLMAIYNKLVNYFKQHN